jgi:hypothetical protein
MAKAKSIRTYTFGFCEKAGRYIGDAEALYLTESGEAKVSRQARETACIDNGLGERDSGFEIFRAEEAIGLGLGPRLEFPHLDVDRTLDLSHVMVNLVNPVGIGPSSGILQVRERGSKDLPSCPQAGF